MDCICTLERLVKPECLRVYKITDEKFARYAIGQAGWRWMGTAPAGQCLLFVGQSARECESCTWNRRFCTERDDAFCPDRSSCVPLLEDCGESRPTDSRVSGIVHVVRQGEAKRGVAGRASIPVVDQFQWKPWPTDLSGSPSTSSWGIDSISFLERDELAVCLYRAQIVSCQLPWSVTLIEQSSCYDFKS